MRALEAPYCLMQKKFTKFLQFHQHQNFSIANILTYHTVVFRADNTELHFDEHHTMVFNSWKCLWLEL